MHRTSAAAIPPKWIAAVLALGVASGARAAEWVMAPDFAVSVDHDTNRTLAVEPIASEGYSMSADMRLQRSTERFDLSVLPEVHLQRFSDPRFDRSDDGSLTTDGLWRTERSQFELNGVLRDQSTLSSEIFSTGVIDLNTRRRDEQANASWSFLPLLPTLITRPPVSSESSSSGPDKMKRVPFSSMKGESVARTIAPHSTATFLPARTRSAAAPRA